MSTTNPRSRWLTVAVLAAAAVLVGWTVYQAQVSARSPNAPPPGPIPVDIGSGAVAGVVPVNLEVRPEKGYLAPDFEAVDIATGRKVRLSDLRGKPVYINFWATWCKWCKVEMPDIQKVYQAQRDKIHVLLVDADFNETPDMMKKFAQDNNLALPMLYDPKGEVANNYLIRALPTSVFINKSGVITGIYPGALDERGIKIFLEEASR
ncbi:MAG: peroxiredoxin family protein [Bacillota bacterium]